MKAPARKTAMRAGTFRNFNIMRPIIFHIRILALVALGFTLAQTATAQIEVAPTRVILSMRDRSHEVSVNNPSDNAVEVNTELGYRLIRFDSLGSLGLDSARTPQEASRSGRDWLKIFPRRFTLAPHTSRLVRVMVTIPDGVDEGEYWARLIVTGTPMGATVPVDADSTQGIDTRLTMRMQLDLPVIIRKGESSTGITLDGVQGRKINDTTIVLVDMNRSGNSAYRGTLRTVIHAADGAEIARAEQQFTAEFALRLGFRFPRLADGNYTLDVESESVKKGGANDAVIPAPTVTKHYSLVQSTSTTTIAPID
jgi:hypothetical protein